MIIIRDDHTVKEAIEIGHDRRTLSSNEVGLLFNSPHKSKSLDCGNYPGSKNGEGVQFAVRRMNGRLEMNLQINGRVDTTLQEIK